MKDKCINLWGKTNTHIDETIANVEKSQKQIKSDMDKFQKKIMYLREDLPYADREDKIYIREELNSLRDKYDVLSRQGDEKDTDLFLKSPYFCNIKTDDDKFYISKYKKDIDNDVFLFTDNIAKLRFYDVDESEKINNHKHTVREKIDYIIEDSKLKEFTHYEKNLTYKFDGEDIIMIKGEMPKVKKALSTDSERKIGMQEIIDRMKLEQDTVMRAPEIGVTLISGGAGTGKTNMAIHRLRYLLNEFGAMFKEENMALVCYNVALKEYLNNVIGDLNLNNVKVFSYDKWAYDIVKNYSNISYINYNTAIKEPTEAAYKSAAFANVLENYITSLKNEIENELLGNDTLKFYIPDQYIFNDVITIKDLFQLRDDIIDNLDGVGDIEETIKAIDTELAEIINKYYTRGINFKEKTFTLNATNMLYKIYVSDELKEAFPDAFFFYKPLFQNKANKYELYAITFLVSLVAGDFNEELKIYDHIAVDEVQDFLPIQLKTLRALACYSMTLAGDVNQKIFTSGANKWDEIGIEVDHFYTLKEVHRSTVQTINFANSLIGNTDKIINDNSGQKPKLNICKDFKESVKDTIDTIKQIKSTNNDASIVVLYPDSKSLNYINTSINNEGITSYVALRDEWDFTKDVSVTNYHQVKGLEFDYVIILGLNEFEKDAFKNKEKVLYTILTRAKERVVMYCYDNVPEIFGQVTGELYEVDEVD